MFNEKFSFDINKDVIELADWEVENFKIRQKKVVNFFKYL